jgi:atypical dual specificity phosphatase
MTGEQVKNKVDLNFKQEYNCYTMAATDGGGGSDGSRVDKVGGGDARGGGAAASPSASPPPAFTMPNKAAMMAASPLLTSLPTDSSMVTSSAPTIPCRLQEALATINPRERFAVDFTDGRPSVTLPRNTSFVVPGVLAVSSTPKNGEQICAFREVGISLVITLTEETPLEQAWFDDASQSAGCSASAAHTIRNVFVPVPNYHPPTTEQMDEIMVMVADEVRRGGIVLEHCGGGKGRAGTVAACILLKHGFDFDSFGGSKSAPAEEDDATATEEADAEVEAGDSYPSTVGCKMASDDVIRHLRHIRPVISLFG